MRADSNLERFGSGLKRWIGFRVQANGKRQQKSDSTPTENSMNAPARRWSISLRRLALAALSGAAFPVAAQAFTLEMPVDCDMRTVCSIHKFMDHDPSPARMDYACGRLSKDGDNGADFRVPNLAIMEQGVAVTAAADGVVRATREGMADVSVRKIGQDAIRGRFAGNAVVLTHPGGWETQYSHLKLGSVRVRKGERVRAGDVIGEIGLSGNTEFPHVEFSLRRNGKPVDPFVGELAPDAPFTCGAPRAPLWSAAAQAQLAYRPSGVLSAGFAAGAADKEIARSGDYAGIRIAPNSPALVFWIDVFGAEQGDVQIIRLTGPNGQNIVNNRSVLKKNNIAWFAFSGKKRPNGGWPRGQYRAQYSLERDGRIVAKTQQSIDIR